MCGGTCTGNVCSGSGEGCGWEEDTGTCEVASPGGAAGRSVGWDELPAPGAQVLCIPARKPGLTNEHGHERPEI